MALAFVEQIYRLERLLVGAVPVTPYYESQNPTEGLCYSIPQSAYLTLQRDRQGAPSIRSTGTRPERHTTHTVTVSGHYFHGTSLQLHGAYVNKNTSSIYLQEVNFFCVILEACNNRRKEEGPRKEILDRHNATPFLPGKGFVRVGLLIMSACIQNMAMALLKKEGS